MMKNTGRANREGFTLIETMVALAIFMIILGAAVTTINNLMMYAETADRDMLVATENQRGMREMKNDLYCSSRNTSGEGYQPKVTGGELRFKVVTGFDEPNPPVIPKAISRFSNYWVCYWHDTDNNFLVRRFRDSNGNLLSDAPSDFPGAPAQVISQYCTSVNFAMPDPNIAFVVITLTNSIGEEGSPDYATYSSELNILPFNKD